jgi:phosphatidyl-myo-inositol alpha-mannosyltransferase
MRVAIVSPYDLAVPGGVQAHAEHLAAALRASGDEVEVFGPRRSMKIRFNGSVAPIGLDPLAGRRLRADLEAARPDVIHVHEPLVPLVGIAAARCRLAPVVATFHAWSDRDRAYRLARPVGRRLVRGIDDLLAVSEAAAGYHAGALGLPREAFTIVPNGVDVARFSGVDPLPELHDPDRPTLLFVGRLEPRKGLETLVRAFGLLKPDRPDLRLLVVGDGAERARCQELLPTAQRADVVFLGRVANEELPGIYAAADVYVSPALGGESFGIVLLEAMAAGTPVVASDIPGYRSVVTDGEDGRLVPPRDPATLAEAIGTYLDDRALRDRVTEVGRRTAARYDWPVVAQEVRARYLAVL